MIPHDIDIPITRNNGETADAKVTELIRGSSLKEALIESGAVRFRPILLTAGAAMLGAWPITLDAVFSGLARSLIFGLVVSNAFTLLLVPVVYWMLYRGTDLPRGCVNGHPTVAAADSNSA